MIADPIYWGLVVLGIVAQFAMALKEASDAAGTRVWPQQYVKDNPYDFFLGAIGGIAAGFWIAPDAAGPSMGLAAGLAGTGFLERLSKVAKRKA